MLDQCIITGFADEIDKDIKIQVKILKEIGQNYIELRGANGKNISAHTIEEANALKNYLDEHGIRVSAIGSPIGKIHVEDDFEEHFKLYQYIVYLSKLFETKYIRIFSFFVPFGEADKYKDVVFSRLRQFVNYAESEDVILLHENEKDIYGDRYARCEELMKTFYGEHFKCIFDFANFVQCGEDTREAYYCLKDYIHYLHIKDANLSDGQVVLPGDGDGNLRTILKHLDSDGFQGYLSLEPHLSDFMGFQELENRSGGKKELDGIEGYRKAYGALCQLLGED